MMTSYQARKNEVLGLYEKFDQLMKEEKNLRTNKTGESTWDKSLLKIEKKVGRIQANEFNLMVAGEAKSGKSTFINAYLGVELLPSDVKQCTSTIIEIKHGEKFLVQAEYANGRSRKFDTENEAKDFLKKNAALDDDYRDIPVPIINNDILIKAKGVEISNSVINELLKKPEVEQANIYGLSNADYKEKIQKYIKEKKDNWEGIVTKIEVIYPLHDDMKGIKIIDSPGIGALGAVGSITTDFIKEVDSIIFLKTLTGQALESASFNQFKEECQRQFLNKNSSLFLIFTRAGDLSPNDFRRLQEEAKKQFKDFDEKKILFVDSKAEIYANQFSKVDDIVSEKKRMKTDEDWDGLLARIYDDNEDEHGGKDGFIRKLRDVSRFQMVSDALDTFGRKAALESLKSLLHDIDDVYNKLIGTFYRDIDLYREVDMEEMNKKIEKHVREIENIKYKISNDANEIQNKFNGDEGVIIKKTENGKDEFRKRISRIRGGSEDSFRNLELESSRMIGEFDKFKDDILREVVAEFDQKLLDNSGGHFSFTETFKPHFTKEDFDFIREKCKDKAKVVERIEEGRTIKKVKERIIFSSEKHYQLVKKDIERRLDDITLDLAEYLFRCVDETKKKYVTNLIENMKTVKKELDGIKQEKTTAEDKLRKAKELENFVKQVEIARQDAEKIKGGM